MDVMGKLKFVDDCVKKKEDILVLFADL